jgi:4-carboxymuconolactone decarboxylase
MGINWLTLSIGTTYCGVPAGVDAMKTAEKVLDEMADKGEMARELGAKVNKG